MLHIDTSDRREQRKFGLVVGIAFVLLGMVRWGFHRFDAESMPYILWTLGGTLFVLGAIAPGVLKPVFVAWIKLAEVLNFVMTRLFLTIVFYAILTPVGLYNRAFGDDPLKRKFAAPGESYWEAPEEMYGEGLDSWKRQF